MKLSKILSRIASMIMAVCLLTSSGMVSAAGAEFTGEIEEIGGESTGVTAVGTEMPNFRSPTGIIGQFAPSTNADVEVSLPTPEIGGVSTGITAEGTEMPDFKSPTGIIGEFPEENGISPLAIDDVVNIKGTPLFRESGVGTHYYAFSGYGTSFTSAFANIKLPTGFNNANHSRNGFVSLGIYGSKHGIDLGLINEGNGWFPVYYDVGVKAASFPEYIAPSTATNAIITVKPINTTTVHLYIQFLNASGQNVGGAFDSDIPVSSGNLTMASNGRISCRFYRFASLVPMPGTQDNQSDGTYMTGGQTLNCQLYNGSSYVGWGMTSSNVTNAWKVSSSKITLTYAGNNDTYNIRHS